MEYGFKEVLQIFWPLLLLQLVVALWALVDLFRRSNTLLGEMVNLVNGASNAAEIALPLATTAGLSLAVVALAGLRFARIEL